MDAGRSTDIHYAPQLLMKITYVKMTILKLRFNIVSFPMTETSCELPHLLL